MEITIGKNDVGMEHATYFIAEIGANHDGDLKRAIDLIHLAAKAGASAAKFQNFQATKIVSDIGFRSLGSQLSHQASWEKSVYDVYDDASTPFEWTPILSKECKNVGIDYFSSPYDFDAVDMLEPYVPAYKIGSGDITWLEFIKYIASKGKPVLLSTGASKIGDVQEAVQQIVGINHQLVILQCNTNYTGKIENFAHVHLNVLQTYRVMYPDVVMGLSDHTPGHSAVLGAVALGARVIEKHFTDDRSRKGPDHPYAMDFDDFSQMVARTRELELALGSSNKYITENELDTVVIQRRCLRAACDINEGEIVTREMIDVLRPASPGAISPSEIDLVIGRTTAKKMTKGEAFSWGVIRDSIGGK